jgi:signal transduction histidine kinase/FixJ family two-component response regulator
VAGECSVRSLVLAPTGRDSALIVSLLRELGVVGDVCGNTRELAEQMSRGAGLAIIADEALKADDLRPISAFRETQGAWSDLPVILLTQRGGIESPYPELQQFAEVLGNVNFLERPFHPATLASMVRAAARNRHRQYEARARHEEITERENQLQTALKAGRLGSWAFDVRTLQLQTSDASRGHFGRHAGAPFEYGDLLQAIHPEDRKARTVALNRAISTGDDYISEFRNIWPDGSVHWMDVRARALTDAAGRVTRLVGVSSDITSRKNAELEREDLVRELAAERTSLSNLSRTLEERVEERTRQLKEQIEMREKAQVQLLQSQKMESVGQLTGGIAHDFNNLLMAVMGSLEILKKRLPPDAGLRRLVDGAMQGAKRGASLTQRMLAFARQQDLKTTSVDLGSLLIGMQDLLHRSIGPQIDLRVQIKPDLPAAEVHAHQVELAILNLAINARDAMPDGGAISIDLDQETVGEGDHGQRLKPGHYLRVRVTDTGTGMDAVTLAKAIEPFFSTKPAGKGTGLGLSMTHGLALQLGGAFGLNSEIGKGTVATIWLPVAVASAEMAESIVPQRSGSRNFKVLIVDDDALVAMSTIEMLEDLGHTVTAAHSAKSALELLESGQGVDVLVTDHAMPGMTGIELAGIVQEKHPGLPILLVTGYADLPAGKVCRWPRLSKPYQQSQLQSAIEALFLERGEQAGQT